jgi:preprotein translocase SecE subunit
MASETKTKEDKAMAADTTTTALVPGDADEPRGGGGGGERPPERAPQATTGFFAIYKKGQGYWTRMGTAIGAGLLGILITWQIYRYVPAFVSQNDASRGQRIGLISAAIFAVLYGLIGWRVMNKPGNVDFLIATDSEMKKVNWTSKRELIGSTKVVILFMFAIAILLFVLDLLFNTLFYAIRVLKIPWWEQIFGH